MSDSNMTVGDVVAIFVNAMPLWLNGEEARK